MKIQRERFLLLTAALAGCHSASPGPAAVEIWIAAPKGEVNSDGGVELDRSPPTSLVARCARLGTERGCDAYSELCEHYLEELTPSAAMEGAECLEALPACDRCAAFQCTSVALTARERVDVPECQELVMYDESDWYRQLSCSRYAARMNPAGRSRYVDCLQNERYRPAEQCLWLPSSCSEHDLWNAVER